MSEISNDPLVKGIMHHLRWAYQTNEQADRLEQTIAEWVRDKIDINITIADIANLADRFMADVDVEAVVGKPEKGKVVKVAGIFFEDGKFLVTFWRSNGTDKTMVFKHNLEQIQRNILRVAIAQDTLAAYAFKRVFVRYNDLDGLTRAWASGSLYNLNGVRVLAEENFEQYVQRKEEEGTPLPCPVEDFVIEVYVEEKEG